MPPLKQQRGTKRKLDLTNEEDVDTRLTSKLFHGFREARKAAKKAKTHETQRIVRKLKELSKETEVEDGNRENLEAQLNVLKKVNYERIGSLALKNKLKKDKVVSKHPSVLSALSAESSVESSSTPAGHELQVEARLLSSKVLSGEVNGIISSLRSILRPEAVQTDLAQPPTKTRKLSTAHGAFPAETGSSSTDTESVAGEESNAEQPTEEWESGTVEEEKEEFSSESELSGGDAPDGPARPRPVPAGAPSVKKATKTIAALPRAISKDTPATTGGQSTFLPSLSQGFTRGDSDSDWSDGEADIIDTTHKNRRGQRARRAIWEKKYGRNAKHLTKSESTPDHRRLGRAPTEQGRHGTKTIDRSSVASRDRQGGRAHHPARGVRDDEFTRPRQSSKPVDSAERPLHPSWEAKRKLKQRDSGAIVAPQGKRIVFDG
ncbi:Bud-site selection protein [Artomyces pyxidatus]|uniref:Bud-site selection protein n=1 Tax=Artomyces pyxidatus TaxID=48021 RepID=A0ACB8T0M7_9AGAM|nr:Bud-site selection protein [Artomyces pyxidatus]